MEVVVAHALKHGYRLIDTAAFHGYSLAGESEEKPKEGEKDLKTKEEESNRGKTERNACLSLICAPEAD